MYYEGVVKGVAYQKHLLELMDETGVMVIPAAVVDVVLTGALETVWLPVVVVDRYLYYKYPPLVVLIEEGRYDELERCLESGTNPDKAHRRHRKLTPIQCSIDREDGRAFELLAKHGAKVPRMEIAKLQDLPLEFASSIIENDLYELTPPPGNCDVYDWCVMALGDIPSRDNADKLEIILVKLLKAGYSVESNGKYPEPATALDLVLMAPNLSSDVKARLEKALREAGAETYPEKVAKNPSLPHLDLRRRNVDPVFAKFLHVLQCAECPEGILVTTTLPGLPSDVPVLVVDFKTAKREWRSERLAWVLGVATEPMQWFEGGETRTGEIPAGVRLIVAPDHVEIPSQVGDLPKEILQEARFKVPGFNILLLEHNQWVHPAIRKTIARFALLDQKRYKQFILSQSKSGN